MGGFYVTCIPSPSDSPTARTCHLALLMMAFYALPPAVTLISISLLLYYCLFFLSLDYIGQVIAESEEIGMTHIDPGTALSIELSNTLPQQLLLAARKRKQQQLEGGGISKRRRTSAGAATASTTNAFGDSEDEAESAEDEEDDVFNEDADNDITTGGVLDLYKFRVSKRQTLS